MTDTTMLIAAAQADAEHWHRMHTECLARLNEEMARAEAVEAERDRLQMRIDDYRCMAFAETNPANIKPGETDNDLMNRFAEMLDKIANDDPGDGSEDWIERFFAERDALRSRCARLEKALEQVAYVTFDPMAHRDNTVILTDLRALAERTIRAALSDTAQQETSHVHGLQTELLREAADMRERAAKLVEETTVTTIEMAGDRLSQWRGQFAAAIRALPLNSDQEG